MIASIKVCKKCGLCKHQPPLLDEAKNCQVFWVGLSAKLVTCENERPLSPATNSGSLLSQVENECVGMSAYRTNLVKCAPLTEQGKLRYPNKKEINICMPHLEVEINELSPKLIFLLGGQVTESISKKYSIHFEKWHEFDYTVQKYKDFYFVPIHHPSYIYVYKRKRVKEYIASIENIINKLL